MENQELKPISSVEFWKKTKTSKSETKVNFEEYFKPQIESAKNFAIEPFYWFIPDNYSHKTVAASVSY